MAESLPYTSPVQKWTGWIAHAGSRFSARLGRNSALVNQLRPGYERLLGIAALGKGISWPVNGEPLHIDPRMRRLVAREVEPELMEFLRQNIRPRNVVVDIGSFLGVYATLAARWSSPGGRVLAFEPTPAMVPFLRSHLQMNDVADRVQLFECALGAESGSATLHLHSDPYRNSLGGQDPDGQASGTATVPIVTLDQICHEQGVAPDLIRMDVQGFEQAVLAGARETIARGRGRLKIVLEVHPQLWSQMGITPQSFDALLAELGVRAVPLGHEPLYTPDAHVTLEYL